jgi:hypothetical protein
LANPFCLILADRANAEEILFYFMLTASFGDVLLKRRTPVSTGYTRKSFLVRLGGLLLAAGIAPKIFARKAPAVLKEGTNRATLRPDPRAIARREDSF